MSGITAQQLVYAITLASDPQVSPDGSRLVHAQTTFGEDGGIQTDIWLREIDGGNAVQLTRKGSFNGGARWSPDGRSIAFVSNRTGKVGIHLLPVAGGEAHLLLEHERMIGALSWSPDGNRIAYTVDVEPELPSATPPASVVSVYRRADFKQDGRGAIGDTRSQLWFVDISGGESRQLTHEPVDHYYPSWSPDGRTIAVLLPNRSGICSQVGLVDVASGNTTRVGPERGTVSVWSWSHDSRRILFAGDTAQTWQTDFFLHDVDSGVSTRLTHDLDVLPEAGFPGYGFPSQPIWLDERTALFHANSRGRSGLYTLDLERATVSELKIWEAVHSGMNADRTARYIAQSHSSFESTGEIAVYDREKGETRVVTGLNRSTLAESPPATWERIEVVRDGSIIEGWLLKPADFDPSHRYPLVLDIHGGPNWFYGYTFDNIRQCLATNGILVLLVNPRGSTSYGRDFAQAIANDWGGADEADLLAMLDAACALPFVDAGRMGVYGYSYGGYMTAWMIGRTRRFKAAVCGAPCFDLESIWGTSDIGEVFGDLQWGGAPHENRAWYAERSPSTYAHQTTTPTLILHWEGDIRCPIGQSEQMFTTLTRAGCEVEYARYPGGSHLSLWVGPAAQRADMIDRILRWFSERL